MCISSYVMTITMIMSNILSNCLDLRYPEPDPEPRLLTITRPEVKKCYSSQPGYQTVERCYIRESPLVKKHQKSLFCGECYDRAVHCASSRAVWEVMMGQKDAQLPRQQQQQPLMVYLYRIISRFSNTACLE